MSEQTPDTNNNLSDGQDPSMEDILASIRKIIADDDEQDGTADVIDEVSEIEVAGIEAQDTAHGDLTELAHTELAPVDTLDLDIITEDTPASDMDIDALIGNIDAQSSGALEVPQIETPSLADDVLDDVLDLEIPLDDSEVEALAMDNTLDLAKDDMAATSAESAFEGELDDLIADMDDDINRRPESPKPVRGLMGGAMAALGLGGAAVAAKEPPEDDLSLMLDNMLEDSASHQEEAAIADAPIAQDRVIDPAADLLSELDMGNDDAEDAASSKTDPDMDLVKSLMADLTEEPLHDEDSAESIDEISRATSVDIDDEPNTDDVMDEILSMTLDDETKLSEEIAIPDIPTADAEPAALSLKEIAAQADADAQRSDSGLGKGLAAAAGLGVVGAAAMAATSQEDDSAPAEADPDDIDNALLQLDELLSDETAELEDLDANITPEDNITDPHLEETPTMARAKKSDAIIDEVTESATAGAFASLTSVVEEKATVAERGDRIGDLVMEALQPMLKEWLDANLKGIVERAVTKEVKRISSGK